MPFSNWLHHIAIRIFLIGVLLLGAGSGHSDAQNDPHEQPQATQPTTQQQQSRQETPPLVTKREDSIDPDWSKPRCDKPQAHNEADLCQQIRMADSAEKTVFLNAAQLAVAVIAGILLWLTLKWSRRAAVAASEAAVAANISADAAVESAKAGRKAADLAEESINRFERPYIYIFGVNQIETGGGVHVKYSVANFGRTPAKITFLAAGMSVHPEKPLDPLIIDYRDDPEHDLLVRPILEPGDTRKNLKLSPPDGIEFQHPRLPSNVIVTSYGDLVPILKKGERFFVWIRLHYRGPLGDYMTNGCWCFDGLTKRLVPWGYHEQQYNGMI